MPPLCYAYQNFFYSFFILDKINIKNINWTYIHFYFLTIVFLGIILSICPTGTDMELFHIFNSCQIDDIFKFIYWLLLCIFVWVRILKRIFLVCYLFGFQTKLRCELCSNWGKNWQDSLWFNGENCALYPWVWEIY